MTSTQLAWRDRVILILGWGVIAWGALASWATYIRHVRILLGVAWWADALRYLHIALIVTAAILPLPVLGLHRLLGERGLSVSLATGFRRRQTLYVLLFAFTFSPLYQTFVRPNRFSPLFGFFAACIVVLVLCWFFYRREQVDIDGLLLAVTWGACFLSTVQTLASVSGIKTPWATGYAAIFGGVLLFLVTLPLLLLVSPARRILLEAVRWTRGLPLWTHFALYAVILLYQTVFWQLDEPPVMQPILRLLTLPALFSGALVALRLRETPQAAPPPGADARPSHMRWMLLAVIAGYVTLAVPLAINWTGAVNVPDGLAYFQIARRYAAGNPVVRGHWSPLISWVLAPAVALGFDPEVAQRALVIVNGVVWILLAVSFARRFGLGPEARLSVAGAMALLLLKYGFWPTSPDILTGTLLLLYFYLVTDDRLLRYPLRFGALTGLVGAFAYFAKAYSLPFVAAHLVMMGPFLALHGRDVKRVAAGITSALAAMLIVALPWVLALSLRFGGLTFTTVAAFNNAALNPAQPFKKICVMDGLCPQPDDLLFPWEDADPLYFSSAVWSPFDNWEHFRYQINLTRTNFRDWAQNTMPHNFGLLPPLALIGTLLTALVHWQDAQRRFWPAWLILTVAGYLTGYMLGNAADIRFYYTLFPLLVIAVYTFVHAAWLRIRSLPELGSRAMLAGVGLVLLVGPMISFTFKHSNYLPGVDLFHPIDPCRKVDSFAMRDYLTAPMAGTDGSVQYISYYTGLRTYGAVRTGVPPGEIDAELQALDVATLVAADETGLPDALRSDYGYNVIAGAKFCDSDYTILQVPLNQNDR